MAGALTLSAGLVGAADKTASNGPRTDADVTKSVRHEIRMYPYYSIFDDISFRVTDGHVELTGAVTEPIKKSDIANTVRRLPGVASVEDDIKVLPLSPNDNLLRRQVALSLFRYPQFTKYAMEPVPSIHIIVENGHVTLTGVVDNQTDKDLATVRASVAGLSFGPIVNNLEVERPAKKS
jgi:hyperosmotically inducible protein